MQQVGVRVATTPGAAALSLTPLEVGSGDPEGGYRVVQVGGAFSLTF